MEETRGTYRVLVGKTEGKRPLLRRRFRSEDNIKIYKSVGRVWTGLTWLMIGTSVWLLVNAVMNLRVP
jgi:hypothetical protein